MAQLHNAQGRKLRLFLMLVVFLLLRLLCSNQRLHMIKLHNKNDDIQIKVLGPNINTSKTKSFVFNQKTPYMMALQ